MRIVLALCVVLLTVIAVSTLPNPGRPGKHDRVKPEVEDIIGAKKRSDGVVGYKREVSPLLTKRAPGKCNSNIKIWDDRTVSYAFCDSGAKVAGIANAIGHLEHLFDGLLTFEEVSSSYCSNPSSAPRNFISIETTADGCWSYIGSVSKGQTLNVQAGSCIQEGLVEHEFIHALGAPHPQQRSDSGNYITANLANVKSGMEDQFKVDASYCTKCPYQTCSDMHYNALSFSKDKAGGAQTLVPKDPKEGPLMGSQRGLTAADFCEIYVQYGLDSTPKEQACAAARAGRDCSVGTDFNGIFSCCVCPAGFSGDLCEVVNFGASGETHELQAGSPQLTVKTPGYDGGAYPEFLEYSIFVKAPEGSNIAVTIDGMVEDDIECYWDQFFYWYGASVLDCPKTVCGDERESLTTESNFFYAILKSDDYWGEQGLKMTFNVV